MVFVETVHCAGDKNMTIFYPLNYRMRKRSVTKERDRNDCQENEPRRRKSTFNHCKHIIIKTFTGKYSTICIQTEGFKIEVERFIDGPFFQESRSVRLHETNCSCKAVRIAQSTLVFVLKPTRILLSLSKCIISFICTEFHQKLDSGRPFFRSDTCTRRVPIFRYL